MKLIFTLFTFCFITQIYAQPNERFYAGTNGKKIKQQGQNISLETCDDDSYLTLNINAAQDVESQSKKFKGSCSITGNDVQLSDKSVLKTRLSQFSDTLIVTRYHDNGRLAYQKSILRSNISRFQQKIIAYDKGGFIASFITYPTDNNPLSAVGYIVYDSSGVEIARKTVDELADPSPFAILLDGVGATDFYILQGTHAACGKYKLHKMTFNTKFWTTALNYDLSCDNLQLQSFAINNAGNRLGLLFMGTSSVTFSKYFMVNNTTGTIIPTTFDISTRVRYNTRTTFGRNNEVYFARVIDYNTVISPVPDRSALELLRFDIAQNLQFQKRYFDTKKRDTDTIPQIEDMLVTQEGNIYVSGTRLKKTWLFSDKDVAFGTTPVQQSIISNSTYIRQVLQEANNPNIIIEMESAESKELKFDIFNAIGQVIQSEKIAVQKGVNAVNLNLNKQGKGLYIIKINNVVGQPSYKFTKL